MAVPTNLTAALSGATYSQLVYWRSQRAGAPPRLVPEHRDGRIPLYSFRDVIALRTFAYLRENVSLQKIREAVRTLDRMADERHLSSYRLYATDISVVWISPEGAHIDLVKQPGHLRAEVVMREVFGPFTNAAGRNVSRCTGHSGRSALTRRSVGASRLCGEPACLMTWWPA